MAKETTLERIGGGNAATICDVVFLHGLNGDTHATWQADKDSDDCWLNWVASDHPEAAVWTVGYDASPTEWFGRSMPIYQRAKNLLARLEAAEIGLRPLAFITHSMGGLVVKEMLSIAEGIAAAQFSPLAENTKIVVFVSTPHQGSHVANYLSSLSAIFRTSSLMEELRANEAGLIKLNDWFRVFVQRRNLKVVSFHEEAKTNGMTVVDNASSDFGYPGILSIGEALNHFEICKPRQRDSLIPEITKKHLKEFVVRSAPGHPSSGSQGASDESRPTAGPRLTYVSTTEIDPTCTKALLSAVDQPMIIFFDDIAKSVSALEERNRRPDDFVRQHISYSNTQAFEERERVAESTHGRTMRLLRHVRKNTAYCTEKLQLLLLHLKKIEASEELATKSLRTFAALSALLLVQSLKRGYDLVEGKPYGWFESYKFTQDLTYCLLDRIPHWGETGKRVFGYGLYVGTRVGNESCYEYAMIPLKVALPFFKSGTPGDLDVFFTWILPQLFLISGSYNGPENFPQNYEIFLLQGAGGEEWWSPSQTCPWPNCVNMVNTAEL